MDIKYRGRNTDLWIPQYRLVKFSSQENIDALQKLYDDIQRSLERLRTQTLPATGCQNEL